MKMDDNLKAAGESGAADQRSTTSSGNQCSGDLTFADSGPRHDLSLMFVRRRVGEKFHSAPRLNHAKSIQG